MQAQEEITISVIDSPLRFSQTVGMLSPEQIRKELIRQIDAKIVSQAQVARHLSVAPARIQEVRKGERRIQPNEMVPLAELLGMINATVDRSNDLSDPTMIPNLGRVAQGVWLEQSDGEMEGPVPYDRMSGDPPPFDLFAVTPEGKSMNKRFPPGTRIICRRIPFGTGEYRSGQYIIVSRTAHDLREMTVKRLEIDADGVYWLHSESTEDEYQQPWRIGKPDRNHFTDMEVTVEGRVIRAVQDYENV